MLFSYPKDRKERETSKVFIVSKNRDSMISTESTDCIYIGDDMTIKAIVGSTAKMYRLGLYPIRDAAMIAFDMIASAMGTKKDVFFMPGDDTIDREIRRRCSEHPDKFAANGKKPVRRGGS